ncbi:MAG: cytochrome P450 [Deltaproteobacteria bacterium]|nr:cytochrome P450 [Deltaproteobacteria bacterium]
MSDLVFDPFSYAMHEDPYPTYARLRAEAPAYRNPRLDLWALSRHADVKAAFREWTRYSNRHGVALDRDAFNSEAERSASFLAMDPPRHDRLRALVSKGFTPRRVAELEPRVRVIAAEHLDAVRDRARWDAIDDFAGRLPMDVISEMLGIPRPDREPLRAWADAVVHREEGVSGRTAAAGAAAREMMTYFARMIAQRRARPGDDLTSALLVAEIDGDRLSDAEIMGFLFLMVIAGSETTTKLIGNALYWLWRNPAERARLRDDPARLPQWVEETLRYDNSTQALARVATQDVELHGQRIREGDMVVLLVGSANRDEQIFTDPARYDILRDTTQTLAFGHGIHFCLGASLARLEGRVALEEFWRRFPDYEIDMAASSRVHSVNVRGFAHLTLER